jgi:hypothetical protein
MHVPRRADAGSTRAAAAISSAHSAQRADPPPDADERMRLRGRPEPQCGSGAAVTTGSSSVRVPMPSPPPPDLAGQDGTAKAAGEQRLPRLERRARAATRRV